MEEEEIYMNGEGRKGHGGGGILLLGMDRKRVWWWKSHIPLHISLARKAGRLCSSFSCGCTKPLKGREWGRHIALG